MLFQKARRALSLPYIALILAPLALFAPALLTGKALFWGTPLLQFGPWRYWAWETLRQGSLPLWNPLLGMGAPLVANYQSALFYPPNFLLIPLAAAGGAAALAWGQTLLVLLHLIFAGWGMARLAQRLGLGDLAQAVGGLAFGLSGYLVARAGFLSINAAAAWLPWILLALTPAAQSDSASRNAGFNRILRVAVLFALQLLAGHAQTSWYTLLLAGLWSGFWALFPPILQHSDTAPLSPKKGIRERGQGLLFAWLALAAALLLAAALAAVQLLPVAEYLAQSQRASQVGFDFAMTYSFWPWRFLTLLAPGMFGSPALGDYWGYANYWEDALYIGLLPLLLALGALVKRRAPQPRLRAFLGGLIIVSFALALGKNTPLFPWLYRHIPTFNLFQAPARFSLWAEFALALLAALGAQAWRRPVGRSLYWTRLGVAGALAVVIGAGAAWLLLDLDHPSFVRATAQLGGLGVIAGLLALRAPEQDLTPSPFPKGKGSLIPPLPLGRGSGGRSSIWPFLVTLFIACDLLLASWGLNPVQPASLYAPGAPQVAGLRDLLAGGRLYLPAEAEKKLKFDDYFTFRSFQPPQGRDWQAVRATFLPNLTLLDGLPSANNFDPLLPARYSVWMEALETASGETRERMLNLMAVSVVEDIDSTDLSGVRFDRRATYAALRWLPCARFVKSGSALPAVMAQDWEPESEVILEEEPTSPLPLSGDRACNPSAQGTISEPRWNAGSISVTVQSDEPGYLLVAQTYYPGWRASVDGAPVQVLHANYLFQALPVPAGKHAVRLVYRPAWFYIGVVVSSLSWLFLFLYHRLKPGSGARSQDN